jgi:ABC-2 type transport system ATP-binding protein
MIEVKNLTKTFGKLVAVDDLTFSVPPGAILGLVGPNGAGKTTTLKMLTGILPPTKGTVGICGHDMKQDPIEAKRRLAFVHDEPQFFDYLTVVEHLRFTARIYRTTGFKEKIRHLIEVLELSGKENALPNELSRGMKQKLGIACGLIHDPTVLMFDEPLTGLDPIGIRKMKDIIVEKGKEGVSIIVSSHLLSLVEEICTHVLMIQKGRKVIEGDLKEIAARIPDLKKDARLEEVFFAVTQSGNDKKVSGGKSDAAGEEQEP